MGFTSGKLEMPCHLTEKSNIKGIKGHYPPTPFSPFVNIMLKDDANCECPPFGFFSSRGLWATQKSLCMYFIIIIPKSKWRWVCIIFSLFDLIMLVPLMMWWKFGQCKVWRKTSILISCWGVLKKFWTW